MTHTHGGGNCGTGGCRAGKGERQRGAAGSSADGVKPRTPAPRSRPFHHTVPLRISSRHFSARKQSDVPSLEPCNSPMALLAFSKSPREKVINGNVRVNSQESVSVTLLREISKPEGYNPDTLSNLSCPCLSPAVTFPQPRVVSAGSRALTQPWLCHGTWGSSRSTRGEQLHLLS